MDTINTVNVQEYVDKINELDIKKRYIKSELLKWKKRKKDNIVYQRNLESARDIIKSAVQTTQIIISNQISGIVTKALKAVFDDPYEFKIEFIERRNSTECDLLLNKNNQDMKPLDSCGYGVADVVSLALRVAYWRLGNSRNVLILDEPTRNLSVDKQSYASEIIKKLSEIMRIQFIIITHQKALTTNADEVFEIK